MFGALKNKLKTWATKNREETRETLKEKPKTTKKEIKKKEEKTIFSKFQKTIDNKKFEELFEELQIILLQNNVAYETVEKIHNSLEESIVGKPLKSTNLSKELKSAIKKLLIDPPNIIKEIKESKSNPFVILFSGINGSGKTTTIAKIAHYLQKQKLSVCIAAADTFRAAAIQQIEIHGNNLKIPVIKKDYGSDPASVGFDAIQYAQKNSIDVVLIDTAGRMQNRDSLMKELEKISRVTKPDMKIFLGESTTGNDATTQAKTFDEAIGIDGIILSKFDVDEKGGTALSLSHITGKPVLFLGIGQNYDDIEVFNKDKIVNAIL